MSPASARSRLEEAESLLAPRVVRARAIGELNDLFRQGSAPDPPPNGFLAGRAITTAVQPGADAVLRRVAAVYMPWLGKTFYAEREEGVNVFAASAVLPIRALWPRYTGLRQAGDRVEGFPFRTRSAPGEADPDTKVLKIDYSGRDNPAPVRRVLDELVRIEEGLYLGKVLVWLRGRYVVVGFFELAAQPAP